MSYSRDGMVKSNYIALTPLFPLMVQQDGGQDWQCPVMVLVVLSSSPSTRP